MNESLGSYTGRRTLIAKKLSAYIPMDDMVPTNVRPTSEAAEAFHDNSLWCSWGDQETGSAKTVTVSISQVADGDNEADDLREMIDEECAAGLDLRMPNPEAYEIAENHSGGIVFVLNYLGRVTAIVGNCLVDIWPSGTEIELSELAEAALDIGRTVGCSAYENDFTSPNYPDEWRDQSAG